MNRSICRTLLGATMAVALAGGGAAFAQSPFEGGYFGIEGDYSDFDSADGLGVGIFGGFGRVYDNRTYIGVEANLARSNADGSGVYDGTRVDVRARESYGISLRPGYVIAPQTLLYGRVGWERSKFRASGPLVASRSRTVNGARLGVGAEVHMAPKLFLRTEYSFTWNRDFNATNVATGQEVSPDNNRHAVRIGVGYRF